MIHEQVSSENNWKIAIFFFPRVSIGDYIYIMNHTYMYIFTHFITLSIVERHTFFFSWDSGVMGL